MRRGSGSPFEELKESLRRRPEDPEFLQEFVHESLRRGFYGPAYRAIEVLLRLLPERAQELTRELREGAPPRPETPRALGPIPGRPLSLALSPDEEWLAVGTMRGEIWVFSAHPGQEPWVLSPHKKAVTALAFLPGGDRLVSAGGDGRVVRTRLGSRRTERWMQLPPYRPLGLSVSARAPPLEVALRGRSYSPGEDSREAIERLDRYPGLLRAGFSPRDRDQILDLHPELREEPSFASRFSGILTAAGLPEPPRFPDQPDPTRALFGSAARGLHGWLERGRLQVFDRKGHLVQRIESQELVLPRGFREDQAACLEMDPTGEIVWIGSASPSALEARDLAERRHHTRLLEVDLSTGTLTTRLASKAVSALGFSPSGISAAAVTLDGEVFWFRPTMPSPEPPKLSPGGTPPKPALSSPSELRPGSLPSTSEEPWEHLVELRAPKVPLLRRVVADAQGLWFYPSPERRYDRSTGPKEDRIRLYHGIQHLAWGEKSLASIPYYLTEEGDPVQFEANSSWLIFSRTQMVPAHPRGAIPPLPGPAPKLRKRKPKQRAEEHLGTKTKSWLASPDQGRYAFLARDFPQSVWVVAASDSALPQRLEFPRKIRDLTFEPEGSFLVVLQDEGRISWVGPPARREEA